nr:PREDICTED: uncharacterized protein LOC100877396 [Megachile rotundata]XP_012140573.1 PREDICTED: uncharacterized protein LOC100877396 [Megachile rotundata]
MNKTIFDTCTVPAKMNDDKLKEDYASRNRELDQKCFIAWSPLEENKYLFRQKYVSCSNSVPRRNKRFIRYKISRSLNFDTNIHSSSSESSSFEEDKHLSRSAKIMRALNFNSSPSYYGKTKIKKSLNFNLTPSPKRFMPSKKSIRKALSLNFNSPLSVSNKFLNFDDNPNQSVNSSLVYSSSESIDENQNETPLQQNTKERGILHYSTPNTKLNKKSASSLRSQLKETIDNIICITATPNSQSMKRIKNRLDEASTSRNLFYELYDNSNDRPSTPVNVISIIPESTSAIKRSHKKERFSRRSERGTKFLNSFSNDVNIVESDSKSALNRYSKHIDPLEESLDPYSSEIFDSKDTSLNNSGNQSDTGSIFDYAEEEKTSFKELVGASPDNVLSEVRKFVGDKVKLEGNTEDSLEIEHINENELPEEHTDIPQDNLSDQDPGNKTDVRSVTPEPVAETLSVTPENRINFLQNILKDSIKKSHKKIKDDNKKKLFTPKVLRCRPETVEQKKDATCWRSSEQNENVDENKEASTEDKNSDSSKEERACTPERVNSSRLLLSQFSSVKKSHRKDKHNKILSGFLKRQEYFNKEMDLCQSNADDTSDCKDSAEKVSSSFDATENIKDLDSSTTQMDDTPSLKLSPSKRRRSLNISLEHEANTSYDSELQDTDTSKEEFKIFTPLKRKRPLITPNVKGYLHFYDLPSGQDEISEDVIANVASSRCLTPIPNFRDNYTRAEENDIMAIKYDNDVSDENCSEVNKSNSSDINGRSTPRDMPTTELYFNVDSIKRSHKKNKRGNSSWKSFNSHKNGSYTEAKEQPSVNSIEDEASESSPGSNECIAVYDPNQSVDSDYRVEASSDHELNDEPANVTAENVPSNITPPNCLKMKNYMRLIQETSIKRSHKKVRDKKKTEGLINTSELSDDGSIFGDEEKLTCNEDQSI